MGSTVEDSVFFQESKASGHRIISDLPKFELESYIANYEGVTRLYRLQAIALASPPLAADALRLAVTEARHGANVESYLALVSNLDKLLPSDPLATIDTAWVENATRKIKTETDRLEHELKTYKNNLIKESIRMGQEDLGNHYFKIGDYSGAFKAYSRMREFCTSSRQVAQMTFKLLYVTVIQQNWPITLSYQPKIGALQLPAEEKTKYEPILFACVGLAHLEQGNYRDAARAFLNVDQKYMTPEPQGGVTYQKQVVTPNDVAIYGGLSALATMDRAELQRRVLDNASFRPLLELEPHIRRAITMFCSSKYKSCLAVLEQYTADYLLDLYLQKHFLKLYQLVRSKCIVQWFSAYSRVTWNEIAIQFPNSLSDVNLEDELAEMIKSGDLDARIDLVDKVLVSPSPDPRISVIQDTLNMAKSTEHALKLRMHTINMKAAGLVVKNPMQQNMSNMMDSNSEFFAGAMGLRQQAGMSGHGKFKRGASGLGQGGGGGASMV